MNTRVLSIVAASSALAFLLHVFSVVAPAAAQQPLTDEMKKSLMITDESVVGSKTTPPARSSWTFKHLIEEMSGGFDPSEFVKAWMLQFLAEQKINGLAVAARPNFKTQFLDVWKAKDGAAGASDAEWKPNLANAPLRLSAIVYRPDLMKLEKREEGPSTTIRNVRSAGEGRFIFQAVDGSGDVVGRTMTVIFEYDLVADTEEGAIKWAQDWLSLSNLELGSAAYLDKLEAITRKFSGRVDTLDTPNNVALHQIRTNEFFDSPWELREFKISAGGRLMMDTVKINPDLKFQGTAALGEFVKGLAADTPIVVPSLWKGSAFLAGSSLAETPDFKWTVPDVDDKARARLSRATCNGCHTGETETRFVHVDLRPGAKPISKFLAGSVPATGCSKAELDAEVGDLANRACMMRGLATARPEQFREVLASRPSAEIFSFPAPTGDEKAASTTTFDLLDFLDSRRDRVH
jgi:hypothetical protein